MKRLKCILLLSIVLLIGNSSVSFSDEEYAILKHNKNIQRIKCIK